MLYRLNNQIPKIARNTFIAPSASVIGDVTVQEHSSIWFNCTVRGDGASIYIGNYTNIQDNSVVHIQTNRLETIIENYVTVGHNAVIHAAHLKDHSFVGIGATVLDEVLVNSYALVAAGALVPPNFIVPSYTLVAGVPAKIIRDIKETEIRMIKETAKNYALNAKYYNNTLKLI